jgi:hypothetical protein
MKKTELANMALSHNGIARIDDIDDNQESAEICKLFIPVARQQFLRQSKLYLSRKEQALSLASGEESEVYDYVYVLPSDCLQPIKIWNGNIASDPVRYEIGTHSNLTSSVVKTNYEGAILFYSTDIENLNVYKMDAILAMSYLLAALTVMPLKVDKQLTEINEGKYLIALSIASANDKNSQSVDVVNSDRFKTIENSRRGTNA